MSLDESLAILEAKFVDNEWVFLAELRYSIKLIVSGTYKVVRAFQGL